MQTRAWFFVLAIASFSVLLAAHESWACRRVRQAILLPPPLTAEAAKQALLEMLQTTKFFSPEVLEKVANMKIEDGNDGLLYWSAFTVNRSKAVYSMRIGPSNPEVKACTFFYSGTFELANGRWTATPPKLDSTALGGGP